VIHEECPPLECTQQFFGLEEKRKEKEKEKETRRKWRTHSISVSVVKIDKDINVFQKGKEKKSYEFYRVDFHQLTMIPRAFPLVAFLPDNEAASSSHCREHQQQQRRIHERAYQIHL